MKPAILFSLIELQRSELPQKNCLIAHVLRGRSKMGAISDDIVKHWGLNHTPIIGMIDKQHVLIKLFDCNDFNKAWTRNSHEMEGAVFRLFKWTMDFSLHQESSISTVWIRLPLLPLNFCILSFPKAIIQPICKFLAADLPTSTHVRPAYARFCVEMDLVKPIESSIWIRHSMEAGFWQHIEQ